MIKKQNLAPFFFFPEVGTVGVLLDQIRVLGLLGLVQGQLVLLGAKQLGLDLRLTVNVQSLGLLESGGGGGGSSLLLLGLLLLSEGLSLGVEQSLLLLLLLLLLEQKLLLLLLGQELLLLLQLERQAVVVRGDGGADLGHAAQQVRLARDVARVGSGANTGGNCRGVLGRRAEAIVLVVVVVCVRRLARRQRGHGREDNGFSCKKEIKPYFIIFPHFVPAAAAAAAAWAASSVFLGSSNFTRLRVISKKTGWLGPTGPFPTIKKIYIFCFCYSSTPQRLFLVTLGAVRLLGGGDNVLAPALLEASDTLVPGLEDLSLAKLELAALLIRLLKRLALVALVLEVRGVLDLEQIAIADRLQKKRRGGGVSKVSQVGCFRTGPSPRVRSMATSCLKPPLAPMAWATRLVQAT